MKGGETGELPRAAVLVALGEIDATTGSPWALLTVRSKNLSLHPGEVSFAGGKAEPGDESPVSTALREAREEIGLPPESVKVLTMLTPIVSRLGMLVYPVVALIPPDFEPEVNVDEVSKVFWVPLKFFLNSANHQARGLPIPGRTEPWVQHEFQYENHRIWGLTANILIQVASIAFNEQPQFPFNYCPYTQAYNKTVERHIKSKI